MDQKQFKNVLLAIISISLIMAQVLTEPMDYLSSVDRLDILPVSFVATADSAVVPPSNFSSDMASTTETLQQAIRRQEEEDEARGFEGKSALSRRRRYLIFPEGSSLQVVFCLTYLSNIPIADVFYLGATASLAWELPQDPYSPFEHHAEALHRKDEGDLVYKDIKGSSKLSGWGDRILVNKLTGERIQPFTKDYYAKQKDIPLHYSNEISENRSQGSGRRVIVNPVFAKRSTGGRRGKSNKKKKRASVMPVDREAMHEEQNDRKHLAPEYMNPETVEFHRMSRRGLYEKIERLIVGMGYHGRECVLKTLCEMGQDRSGKQGSFLEEIMRVIFTLPPGREFEEYHHQGYDEAQQNTRNCTEIYPECSFSLKSLPYPK